jgi:ATP diphosphatase
MPALARAAKLGRRAASVGFDWADLAGVRAKIDEELAEVDEAIDQGVKARVAAELGDLLFSVVNLCRHVGVDPEQSLRGANGRFTERFSYIERSVQAHGGEWMQFSPDDLDALWRAAKLDAERN